MPKLWVDEDGSLVEENDVVCAGIEEKMGIHASSTCSMTLGGKGKCRGLLLGEERQGMKIIKEHPVEQLVRDCKITSIYEGTDGIQAKGLLGRKLGMAKGRVFMNFLGEIQQNHCNGKGNKRIGRINRRSREGRQAAGGGRPAYR